MKLCVAKLFILSFHIIPLTLSEAVLEEKPGYQNVTRTRVRNQHREDPSQDSQQNFGQHLYIQQGRIPQPSQSSPERGAGGGGGRLQESLEEVKERLSSVLLLMTRMTDRLVTIESKQSTQTERIDNINYRITKLDVLNEERKSQLSEITNALRHRLQTTDRELERIHTAIENIQTAVGEVKQKVEDGNRALSIPNPNAFDTPESSEALSSIMAGVFGLKASNMAIRAGVEDIARNFSVVERSIRKVSEMGSSVATKQDLLHSIAGMSDVLDSSQRPSMYMAGEARQNKGIASDCWELLKKKGQRQSGVYRIQPTLSRVPFFVYCDMETNGGGWTVIQMRQDGSVDFKLGWNDYKHGFGNIAGEHWLGNQIIHEITNEDVNELQIILWDFGQDLVNATYSSFALGSEKEGYAIKMLGEYEGTAGDSFRYHVGQKFSTYDMDNDANPGLNCARDHTGAWWYKACDQSNLNGQYLHGPLPPDLNSKGIYWYDFHGPNYSLWQTSMRLRRTRNQKSVRKTKIKE